MVTNVKLGTDLRNLQTEQGQLTSYDSNQMITCGTPQLVKINNNRFLLMWEVYDMKESSTITIIGASYDYQYKFTNMVLLDREGKTTSDIIETNTRLSDCHPIVLKDGTVTWYAGSKLYSIDPDHLSDVKIMPLESIELSKKETTIAVGESEVITATKKPWNTNVNPITWRSSDENIATVDQNGKITAKKSGTVEMSASCDGKSSKIKVNCEYRMGECPWVVDGTTLILGKDGKTYHLPDVENINEDLLNWDKTWHDKSEITKIVIKGNVIAGNSLAGLFKDFSSLTEIDGLDNLDISNVKSLWSTFNGCNKIQKLDLSTWNTSNVTDLNSTFMYCWRLKKLDIGNWNVSNVNDMEYTFSDCLDIENIDIENWDISQVKSLKGTFNRCNALKGLDISKWDTSEVTNLASTFDGCFNLTSLDVSHWNTSKVKSLDYTFAVSGLESIDVSGWDTSNVESARYTFASCDKMSAIDLSSWDLTKVTDNGYTDAMLNADFERIKLGSKTLFNNSINGYGQGWELKSSHSWQLEGTENVYTAEQMAKQNPQKDHPGWYIISVPIYQVTLSQNSIYLTAGDTYKLTSEVLPENATFSRNVTYSSDNDEIATVDQNGNVTAQSPGKATITAKCRDCSDTTTVTVSKKNVALSALNISLSSKELKIGETVQLSATKSPSDTTDSHSINWRSSNNSIASVDENGKVTAKGAGTATITAQCGNVEAQSVIKVTGELIDIPTSTVVEYDGQSHTPYDDVNDKDGHSIYKVYGDKKRIKAGSYKVRLWLSSNKYSWSDGTQVSKEVSWTIVPRDISKATANTIADQKYTGGNITPSVKLTDLNKTLTTNDYSVSYENNKDVGTAKIIVSGRGNYTGSQTVTFSIVSSDNTSPSQTNTNIISFSSNMVTPNTDESKAESTTNNKASTSDTSKSKSSATTTSNNENKGNTAPLVSADVKNEKQLVADIVKIKGDEAPKGSAFSQLRLKATKVKKTSMKLEWKKVKKASGYILFGAQCGKKFKKITSTNKLSYTNKKLKKGTYYKYMVIAYRNVNGGKKIMGYSKTIHVVTAGKKYGNYTSIEAAKKSVTLKKRKTYKIKASGVKPGKTKVKIHRDLKFESSDTAIATVSGKGKITGKKKGDCTIYVYAQNGVYAAIKVHVK